MLIQDGIFDIETLLEEYPSYYDFVSNALRTEARDRGAYDGVSSRTWTWSCARPRTFVLHSPHDELLSYAQPCALLKQLAHRGNAGEPSRCVVIPQPNHFDSAPALWYRGAHGNSSVASVYQGKLCGVPNTIQVCWDRLQVRLYKYSSRLLTRNLLLRETTMLCCIQRSS